MTVLGELHNETAVRSLPGVKARLVLVVGDMLELGDDANELHGKAGHFVYSQMTDWVVGVGSLGQVVAQTANALGTPASYVDGPEEAAELLSGELRLGDVVLFKASRAVGTRTRRSSRLEARGDGARGRRLMLGELLFSLADEISAFNVFRYVSVRTAAAATTAIILSLGLGPFVISRLSRLRVGERIRADGPAHHHKAGTPTMGGVLIVGCVILSTLLWADLGNVLVWVAVLTMTGFGTLGFLDDWKKLRRGDGIGLSARLKFGVQLLLGLAVGGFLLWYSGTGGFTTRVVFPFWKEFQPELALLFVPAAMLVLLASSNAVNLTDGLDGLAAGCVLIAAAVYTALTYLAGHAEFSAYLDILYLPGASEVTIFGAAITGAALGFLWFNAHPARVFMGDVGSLALGAGIGMQAILIRQEMLLVLVGGVFVLETASVILQVAQLQAHGTAALQDGAAPPSLRARRLARDPGERPVLDPGRPLRARHPDHPEAAMTDDGTSNRYPGAGRTGAGRRRERPGGGALPLPDRAAGAGCGLPSEPAIPAASALRSLGARVHFGGHPPSLLAGMALVVTSPGIPPRVDILRTARREGIPVWGELELGYRALGEPWDRLVAVTGTKGKSSVVTLLAEALEAQGTPVRACGNLGEPLTALAGSFGPDQLAVVETSSFQLATIARFRAHVAVVLEVGQTISIGTPISPTTAAPSSGSWRTRRRPTGSSPTAVTPWLTISRPPASARAVRAGCRSPGRPARTIRKSSWIPKACSGGTEKKRGSSPGCPRSGSPAATRRRTWPPRPRPPVCWGFAPTPSKPRRPASRACPTPSRKRARWRGCGSSTTPGRRTCRRPGRPLKRFPGRPAAASSSFWEGSSRAAGFPIWRGRSAGWRGSRRSGGRRPGSQPKSAAFRWRSRTPSRERWRPPSRVPALAGSSCFRPAAPASTSSKTTRTGAPDSARWSRAWKAPRGAGRR